MQYIAKVILTILILLLLQLVIFQAFAFGGVASTKEALTLLVNPFAFGEFSLAVIALTFIHHSTIAADRKRLCTMLVIAAVFCLRVVWFIMFNDGSFGTLGVIVLGTLEFLGLGLIGVLFALMNLIPQQARMSVRVGIFLFLLAVFFLQTTRILPPVTTILF